MANNDPLIGQTVANYRFERVLGRGGMAQVYYGRDLNLQRPVAIKVIDARFRNDPAYATRFVNEARAVAAWRHENVVQIHYADNQAGLYFFVMEYIDGLDLEQLLKQYREDGELMPYDDVVHIGKAIASALDYAHQKGVIHRDVKPANAMIATDNRVVLMDFGLAMDTAQGSFGEVFGTPHYIAPEQARNSADAVPQSDLYSLGVILYEMLTGAVPFDDPSPTAVALQHLSQPPPPPRELNPNLSSATAMVLLKALAKKPDERYPTGHDLMTALDESLDIKLSTAELPPVPAAVQLSSKTVADKLRVHLQHTPTTTAYSEKPPLQQGPDIAIPSPATPSMQRQDSGGTSKFILIGVFLAIALVVVGGLTVFLLMGGNGQSSDTLPTAIATNPPAEAAIEASPTEAVVLPFDTPIPANTVESAPPATEVPPPTATFTVIPPSATSVPPTNPPEVVAAAPTVLYPDGRRFLFFYNNDGFYLYNASGANSRLDEFVFERLDSLDLPTDRIEGWEFARFAPSRQVTAGWCVKIEIINASAFSPPQQCQGTNARMTPTRGGSQDFWTAEDGSTQFRVVWDGQEVARCEIADGVCEAYLP